MKNRRKTSLRNDVGKIFEFDYELEKTIYRYLYYDNLSKKILIKLDDTFKFNCYHDWKLYITNRYNDYSIERLIEFSRYLNHRIRICKPNQVYWNICITIILTIGITEVVKIIVSNVNGELLILAMILGSLIIGGYLMVLAYKIWNNNVEENMLIDYKEIIDEIIDNRNKNMPTK